MTIGEYIVSKTNFVGQTALVNIKALSGTSGGETIPIYVEEVPFTSGVKRFKFAAKIVLETFKKVVITPKFNDNIIEVGFRNKPKQIKFEVR